MERLQAALEQARKQRQDGTAPAPASPGAPRTTAPAGPGGADWAALPVFTPDPRHLAARRLVAHGTGSEAGPFDMLRTRVMQMMSANGWKRLAITSAGAGAGKTTLAANLALSLGRQSELRTVLVDADLRRPQLAAILGLPPQDLGSGEVLAGTCPATAAALRIGDTLAILAAQRPVAQAAELLQSRRCGDAIAQIEASFTPSLIVFDLPPLQVSDDTLGFLGHVDCALLVVEGEVTPLEQVDRCERELAERTNMLGVVLNKARFEDGDSYSYY